MNTDPTPPTGKSTDMQRVPCQICQKEVPKSEAKVSEATDYICLLYTSDAATILLV